MTRLRISALPHGTPLGRRAGLIGMGFLFAGFNTGNNLFYLVFTMLASSELVGFILARRVFGRLEAEVQLPRRARAGGAVRMTLRLANRGRWFPIPALLWKVRLADGSEAEVRTPALPAGATVTGTGPLVPAGRGWLWIERLEARTDFPVGLARVVVRLDGCEARTLVTPRLIRAAAGSVGFRRGDVRSLARPTGAGFDPMDAREYRPGDDARRIDWKASARSERLMWRDRRGDAPRAIRIRLERSGGGGPEFELRVARAAGAAAAALARGHAVGFGTDEIELLPRSGPSQNRRILEYLALVRPAAEGSSPVSGAGGGPGCLTRA